MLCTFVHQCNKEHESKPIRYDVLFVALMHVNYNGGSYPHLNACIMPIETSWQVRTTTFMSTKYFNKAFTTASENTLIEQSQ